MIPKRIPSATNNTTTYTSVSDNFVYDNNKYQVIAITGMYKIHKSPNTVTDPIYISIFL